MAESSYLIDLDEIPAPYESESLLQVLHTSPLLLRQGVEKFARYFHRESTYDCIQFDAEETDAEEKKPYTAYLFSDKDQAAWAGACCFRTRCYEGIGVPCEALQWIWLHPFCRTRGILKSHWATLRANHGDFYVEPPLSPGMLRFVLKHNADSWWYPLYEGKEPNLAAVRAMLMAPHSR
jgi:hypothetical protein